MKRALFSTVLLMVSVSCGLASVQRICFEQDDAVYVAAADGSAPKKIVGGQSPDLSPDGTKLAFNTVQAIGQPAHRQLAIADLAPGKITILKSIPSDNCMEARWSPDGSRLVFYYYVNNEMNIGIVNADGTAFQSVQAKEKPHHDYWSATWAADGKSLFAEDMESLYRLDLEAHVLKKWTIEKLVPHGGMSGDSHLDASPDGSTLLMDVEMDEKERKDWDGPPPAIWMLDLATNKVTRLTPKTLYAWDCHWLSAPESILFTSQALGENDPSIYRMSMAGQGKDRKRLIKNARGPGASH